MCSMSCVLSARLAMPELRQGARQAAVGLGALPVLLLVFYYGLISMHTAAPLTPAAHSVQELRQGRIKRLWAWGRCLYRCLAFSYGAFSVYEHPWIVRALLTAVWTASRLLIGLL